MRGKTDLAAIFKEQSMRQILQNLKTGDIELAEIPVPEVRPGHLLIRTSRTLVSLGTERMLLEFGKAGWIDKARQQPDRVRQVLQKIRTDGLFPTVQAVMKKLDQPLPLGYCNAGQVLEVGRGVEGFKPGDRVVSNGNHAEIVCIPANLCARIPDSVDDVSAAFTVLGAIALQGVRLADPTLGESVAVLGLGLIGLMTCQILKANGCRVIGFDFDRSKVDMATEFGVEAHALSEGVDPVAAATAFSRGRGVDAVIITAATSSNDPIHQAPQMCRKRGRVILVGVVGLQLSRDDFYKKEITFQVSCSYGPGRYENEYEKKGFDYPIGYVRWTEQRNFEAVLDLMAESRLRTKPLVTHSFPFGDALKAYEKVAGGGNALGIILEYDGSVDVKKRSVILPAGPEAAALPQEPVLGFIGAGNFASSTLVPAFKKTGARLKSIASAGGVSGTHLGKKSGFGLSTTDHRIILDDPEINAIVICTQHQSHASLVLESLRKGKHVFVEKPLCLTPDELEEIDRTYRERAKNSPSILMVGFNRRFSPLVQTAKSLLKGVASPRSLIMTVNAGSIPDDHWTQDPQAGGGRILGEACHFIDLLRYLAGNPLGNVGVAAMDVPGGTHPPDTATITMDFQDGSIGSVHYFSNGSKDFPKERLEIFTGGRILQLDNFQTLTGFGWDSFKKESLWSQDKGHEEEASRFVSAIKKGESSPIPFSEIMEVTRATFSGARLG